jgi:hypothetical protein
MAPILLDRSIAAALFYPHDFPKSLTINATLYRIWHARAVLGQIVNHHAPIGMVATRTGLT